ncbi:MAG: LPS translocon maturation chaperone LptM [Shewanella sp.]
MRLFLSLMLVSILLSACGQKGPLYKTPAAEVNQPKEVNQAHDVVAPVVAPAASQGTNAAATALEKQP